MNEAEKIRDIMYYERQKMEESLFYARKDLERSLRSRSHKEPSIKISNSLGWLIGALGIAAMALVATL